MFSGTEIGRLQGHVGAVKSMQVEDHICLTGSEDGNVRLWDLRKVNDEDCGEGEMVNLSDVAEETEDEDRDSVEHPINIRNGHEHENKDGPCLRVLEGHTKAVTALYFEDECLACFLISGPNVRLTTVILGDWGL